MIPEVQEEETEAISPPVPPRSARNPYRALILGLLLIPVLVFWVEYTEIVASGPDLAAMSLPMAVVFALLLIIPINLLVKRFWPRAALNQAELLMIYSMNVIGVYISGIGMMQFLNPTLVGWSYFATPSNRWSAWEYLIKSWAVPKVSVVADYYNGKSTFFTAAHIEGWARAICIWSFVIFVLLFCFYCIACLMRRQWVQNEKLIFPIVQIPLEITRDGGASPLWTNRIFWVGAIIPILLESAAAVHFSLIPTFPFIPIKPQPSLQIDSNITTPPWNAMGYTTLSFYPLVVGLTFLLSLDVSFSCWFFYLFTKAENIFAAALGWKAAGAGAGLAGIPYTVEQGIGAFVGLALFSLWLARPHLKAAWRQAFCRERTMDERDEPLTYRAAYLGFFASGIFLVGFGIALGFSPFVSVVFFCLYFLLALTMTRIRAEAGLPWGPGGSSGWAGAHTAMLEFGGTQNYSPQELTAFSFVHWCDSDWRCLVQPAQLEAMKMASASQPRPLNPRFLTAAILAATVVGIFAAWICCLGIYYHYGAASALVNSWRTDQGSTPFTLLQGRLNNPLPSNWPQIDGAIAGFVIVGLLAILRTRFVWWPLHPIGYAIGNTDTMTWIWFPTLLGWLFKTLILRYGGVKLYRQALPFFIGLFLGDYAISGIWALIFLSFHMQGYRTFPI